MCVIQLTASPDPRLVSHRFAPCWSAGRDPEPTRPTSVRSLIDDFAKADQSVARREHIVLTQLLRGRRHGRELRGY